MSTTSRGSSKFHLCSGRRRPSMCPLFVLTCLVVLATTQISPHETHTSSPAMRDQRAQDTSDSHSGLTTSFTSEELQTTTRKSKKVTRLEKRARSQLRASLISSISHINFKGFLSSLTESPMEEQPQNSLPRSIAFSKAYSYSGSEYSFSPSVSTKVELFSSSGRPKDELFFSSRHPKDEFFSSSGRPKDELFFSSRRPNNEVSSLTLSARPTNEQRHEPLGLNSVSTPAYGYSGHKKFSSLRPRPKDAQNYLGRSMISTTPRSHQGFPDDPTTPESSEEIVTEVSVMNSLFKKPVAQLSPLEARKSNSDLTSSTRAIPTPDCDLYGSCQGHCWQPRHVTSEAVYSCYCDVLCWLYSDCCYDYYHWCLQLSISAPSVRLLEASMQSLTLYSDLLNFQMLSMWREASSCVQVLSDDQQLFHQVVTRCSENSLLEHKFDQILAEISDSSRVGHDTNIFQGLSKQEIVGRCERANWNRTKAPLDGVHVAHTDFGGVHFHNVFCALCNGVSPQTVIPWETKLICPHLHDNGNNTTWLLRNLTESLNNPTCEIRSYLTQNYYSFARECFPNESDSPGHTDVTRHGIRDKGEGTENTHTRLDDEVSEEWINQGKEATKNSSVGGLECLSKSNTSEGLEFPSERNQPKSCSTSASNNSSLIEKEMDFTLCQRYQYVFTMLSQESKVAYRNPHCMAAVVQQYPPNFDKFSLDPLKGKPTAQIFSLFGDDLMPCSTPVCGCVVRHDVQSTKAPGIQTDLSGERQDPKSPPSFRLLLDFRSHVIKMDDTVVTQERRECPKGQVFVPLYGQCALTSCPHGQLLQHGVCQGEQPCSDQSMTSCPVTNSSDRIDEQPIRYTDSTPSLLLQFSFSHVAEEIETCLSDDSSECAFLEPNRTEEWECLHNCVSEFSTLRPSPDDEIRDSEYVRNRFLSKSACSRKCLFHSAVLAFFWVKKANETGHLDVDKDRDEFEDRIRKRFVDIFEEYWELDITKAEMFPSRSTKCSDRDLLLIKVGGPQAEKYARSDVEYLNESSKMQINEDNPTNSPGTYFIIPWLKPVASNKNYQSQQVTNKPSASSPGHSFSSNAKSVLAETDSSKLVSKRSTRQGSGGRSEGKQLVPYVCRQRGVTVTDSGLHVCLTVNISGNGDLQYVLDSTQDMVKTLKRYGAEHNFIVKSLEIASQRETNRTDCPFSTRVEFKEKIVFEVNGTSVVQIEDEQIPLSTLSFQIPHSVGPTFSQNEQNKVQIAFCVRERSNHNLTCDQYFTYNKTDLLFVNDILIVTKTPNTLQNILEAAHTSLELPVNSSLKDLDYFLTTHADIEDFLIYDTDSYTLTEHGALVCSHYNDTYSVSVTSERVIYWLPQSSWELVATWISLSFSLACLAVVLLVYALLPELRNIPGKIVISFSSTLFSAQLLFLFAGYPDGVACWLYAAVLHCCWLSTFSWLTTMSADLAYVLTAQSHGHLEASRTKAFKIYCLLCWLMPAMLTAGLLALDRARLVSLGYGARGICWLGNWTALLVTLCAPVFLLLLASFSCAVLIMRAIRRSVNFRRVSASTSRKNRSRLGLCVTLSVLMGLSWLIYLPAIVFNTNFLWTAHILVSGAQGFYVMICFVMRREVLRKLSARFCPHHKYKEEKTPSGQQTTGHVSPAHAQTQSTPVTGRSPAKTY